MRFLKAASAVCSLFAAASFAAVLPHDALEPRQASTSTKVPDSACTNGPTTRACWKSGFSIATDFDAKAPPNGVERHYKLTITNITLAPDGVSRLVLAVNGQYPGPTLYADWGDWMVVDVENQLQHNGTSIHWHGIRQLNSCQHDGVNGITECPIAPGATKRYRFRCTQFGTSWYHSHFSAQYGDGVVGAIVINGPASGNYDIDAGTMTLTDWFYETAFAMNVRALHSTTGPPIPDTGLINGTMKNANGGGAYHKLKVQKGKKYRLRLINTGIDNLFHVTIDGHEFTVITSDFVPIKPYRTSTVAIGIGQRHDIIINANQAVGNYWLRADVGTSCGRNKMAGKIRSIISYEGAPDAEPTTTGITQSTACYDEDVTPYVSNLVPKDQFSKAVDYFTMDFNVTQKNGPLIQWLINGSDIRVDWGKPSLSYIQKADYTGFPKNYNVFEIEEKGSWVFWVVQTVQGDPVNLPHPIHLHGHDFYVMGHGPGVWDGNVDALRFQNPSRRDTATLPAGGWLIVGFPADNPGMWLMHCHIPWHVGQGLSLQFMERKEEILSAIGDLGDFNPTCDSWNKYWNTPGRPYGMDDSGL
ncbi:multicopper oxidase [Polychaeton citri CBS 116435]|uniref:laccase n=1 Tax=Polychaeton citri CBS 116435 TaxID=1314669 RepID=A0A9P4UL60_9PEZI|nr:multicopper oxidase [Polychaeton citri CBS 116435]